MKEIKMQRYPAYKDSGVEWLGEIPEHWEVKKLKYLTDIQKGKLPSKIVSTNETNLPPYMSMEYLRGGEANQWVLDKNTKVINENETLILWDGSNAGEFIKSRKGVISSTVAQISFYNIDLSFAWYYSKSLEIELRGKTIGMGIPHVNGNELKNSIIPVPSLLEQTAIANFLDNKTALIDKAIALKQKQIELLKERKQIVIHRAVTRGLNPNVKFKDSGVKWIGDIPEHWEVKKLKHLSQIIDCKNRTPEYLDGGKYLVVRTSNVKDGKLIYDKRLYTDKRNYAIWTERGIPKVGSVLFTREAPAGEACLVPNQIELCLGQRMMSINGIMNQLSNKYLLLIIYSPAIQIYIELMSSGSTVTHLRVPQIFDMPIAVPFYAEQCEIEEYLNIISEKIDCSITLKEKEIEKLKEYKSVLINEAVSGKIKVN